MIQVNIHEAKTHLSRLLNKVAEGEEVIIASAGTPVARLSAYHGRRRRVLGRDQGLFEIPADFDAPLPDDLLDSFER
ncbi:MAG TPA: type II toxin-antitoxin system Phd/YefM family antitoxin [Candidatus Latescibacteria bacterium]|jgi:prevent-host-death family protein|nr:type II toxin-antitoxin system prevent-host-death family antitoxin [Gemmatimonadaceae bacterium]MDP6017118.1 type II toxin-antitoxin system Phd/YefM family antitoxin [Candidatus Latescibacterota bacterium]HJP32379.1 type II toxin-antitoxin system Phd/YefM family antitoxin [Candidatus Latescibacterota bacterium]|tara:strand:- start:171 stop:401 length:231 start_codon:yes stop_codon:yes gene_type:complete